MSHLGVKGVVRIWRKELGPCSLVLDCVCPGSLVREKNTSVMYKAASVIPFSVNGSSLQAGEMGVSHQETFPSYLERGGCLFSRHILNGINSKCRFLQNRTLLLR